MPCAGLGDEAIEEGYLAWTQGGILSTGLNDYIWLIC